MSRRMRSTPSASRSPESLALSRARSRFTAAWHTATPVRASLRSGSSDIVGDDIRDPFCQRQWLSITTLALRLSEFSGCTRPTSQVNVCIPPAMSVRTSICFVGLSPDACAHGLEATCRRRGQPVGTLLKPGNLAAGERAGSPTFAGRVGWAGWTQVGPDLLEEDLIQTGRPPVAARQCAGERPRGRSI
jgi:hypothetical protein